jgi:hypothetical protein
MNRLRLRNLALAGVLGVMTVLSGAARPAPALADGERPDLEITLIGLNPKNSSEVIFRVANVGDWWADQTTVTVETVSPAPGNRVTLDVPDLNPKRVNDPKTLNTVDVVYTLAAPCNGHEVQATLVTARTFNGNEEQRLGNNIVARTPVCRRQNIDLTATPFFLGSIKPGAHARIPVLVRNEGSDPAIGPEVQIVVGLGFDNPKVAGAGWICTSDGLVGIGQQAFTCKTEQLAPGTLDKALIVEVDKSTSFAQDAWISAQADPRNAIQETNESNNEQQKGF